jgi:hypothetical protein
VLLLFEFLGGKYRPAFHKICGVLRQWSFALVFSEMIESRIAGDVKHPCLEPAVVPKGFAILQHPEKDVLNEVLRDRPAADHPGKEVEQSAVVPIEQYPEFLNVTVSDGKHQVFVGFRHFHM